MTNHIGDLIPDPNNARKHNERNLKQIVDSLQEVGAARSIVIDEDNVILAGNGVTEAAALAGIENVRIIEADGNEIIAVRRSNLTPEQKTRLALWDNRAAELATWDADVLGEMYQEDPAVFDGMFSAGELEDIIGDLGEPAEDAGAQIDKAEELREKWGVESGQMWRLGEHRIICGDCTDKAVVDRLMGGERAACMWTDPPYGVEYVGKTKDALTIENDGAEDLPDLLNRTFSLADTVLIDGAPIYVAHPPGALQMVFDKCFVDAGWLFHETLVWVKDSMVLGHSDYHYKHEPIIYGWKGKNRKWYSGRDQVSVFEIPRPKRSAEHPTMKPPELVEACLQNSTQSKDTVYDPFSGSGTTIISCERLNRKCRAIEISPAYVAVAIQRWVDTTGGEPELLTN